MGEAGGRRVSHAPSRATHNPTRGGCCGDRNSCVGYLMPEMFPSVGRSDRGDSKGGVPGRKQYRRKSHRNFFPATKVI